MKKTKQIQRHNIIVALSLALFVVLLINSTLFFTRIDLTESRTYSISEVSKKTFQEIEDVIQIDYYLSDKLRTRAAEVEQVADILYQYGALSRGKVQVSVVDPSVVGVTSQIENAGIIPRQIQVVEQDQQSLAVIYSGVIISYLDRSEVLPFVLDPSAIEYQVTSTIRNLLRNEERVVAVLVGDERKSLNQNYQYLNSQLSQSFTVESIFPGDRVPANASILLLLGASSLDKDDLYPVDQYILNGGSAFIAFDPVTVNIDLSFYAFRAGALPIFDMLAHYGVTVDQHLIADTYNLRIPMQQQSGANVVIQNLVSYPYWVTALASSVDPDHPLTAQFPGLDLFWASPLTITDTTPNRITPLVYSSAESWLITQEPFNTEPEQALALEVLSGNVPRQQYPMVALISGAFTSFFEGVPDQYAEDPIPNEYTAAVDNSKVVVIADTDFLGQVAEFTQSGHNFTFFQNIVTYLSDDEDIIAIQTRANRDVRLNAISNPERRLVVASRATLVNVLLIPLGVVIFGITRAVLRRRRMSLLSSDQHPASNTISTANSSTKSSANSADNVQPKKKTKGGT